VSAIELLERKVADPVYKTEIMAIGVRRAGNAAPFYQQKLAQTSPTIADFSVGIVSSRTNAKELLKGYESFERLNAYVLTTNK
jgi:hypothetical protein